MGSNGHIANPDSLVTTDWAAEHLNDPGVRFVEVDVDTDRLREGPHPRRGRLELAERPSGPGSARDIAPKDAARAAAERARHHARDDGRPLRRQQQLVRGLRLLGSSTTGTTTSSWSTAGARSGRRKAAQFTHRRAAAGAASYKFQRCPTRTIRGLPRRTSSEADRQGRPGRRPLAGGVLGRAPRAPRTCRRKARSAAATSRRAQTSPGPRPSTRTAPSRQPTS